MSIRSFRRNNNKNLARNASLNIIKQCCNIVFPLLSYPIVTRKLGSAELGRFSFSDSVITWFMTIASLGIPTYAIREGGRIRNDKDKLVKFTSEVYTINIIFMILTYLCLVFMVVAVPRFQKDSTLILILSLNIVTNVLGRDWINSIFEDFAYITYRYVAFQTISLILILLFIRESSDIIIYTLIMLFSNAGAYIANFFYTQKYVPVHLTYKLNLKTHIKPILLLFCSAIAIQIYVKSDIIMLGFFRPDEEVGIYTLSSKIYTIVKALLNAVITVTIPRAVSYMGMNAEDKYLNLMSWLKKALITLVLPCITGLFCISEDVMLLIGGQEYGIGYCSLQILCIALFFSVFGCYYAQGILVVNRKDKGFMIATIISAFVNVFLNILLVPIYGINGAAFTTVVAELCVFIICYFYSKKNVSISGGKGIVSVSVGCIGIIFICMIIKSCNLKVWMETIASILGSCIVYGVILIIGKNEIAVKCFKMLGTVLRKGRK